MNIKEAKRILYHEILQIPLADLTHIEIDLGFLLAGDPDIQALLGRTIKPKIELRAPATGCGSDGNQG